MGNIGDSFIGKPHPAQGSHGDIQLRIDDSPKAFFKLADTWYENVLFPAGEGIVSGNIGLEIKHKSKSVASFGDKIRLGRKQNDTGRLEMDTSGNIKFINRQGGTDGAVFSITTAGETQIDTRATGADVPLRITNDGSGYNQILMGGANSELYMGYAGSGASPSSSIAGSSKIFINMPSGSSYMSSVNFARAGSVKFVIGSTYESTTDELRIVQGADPRTEANASIRIDGSGDIGFRGTAPAAAPDWTVSNKTGTSRALDANGVLGDIGDRLAQLVDDLIAMGILQ